MLHGISRIAVRRTLTVLTFLAQCADMDAVYLNGSNTDLKKKVIILLFDFHSALKIREKKLSQQGAFSNLPKVRSWLVTLALAESMERDLNGVE